MNNTIPTLTQMLAALEYERSQLVTQALLGSERKWFERMKQTIVLTHRIDALREAITALGGTYVTGNAFDEQTARSFMYEAAQ